jgi:hypothetical protein
MNEEDASQALKDMFDHYTDAPIRTLLHVMSASLYKEEVFGDNIFTA